MLEDRGLLDRIDATTHVSGTGHPSRDPDGSWSDAPVGDRGWYVVRCKAQEERRAVEHLCNQRFEAFLPTCRLQRRVGSVRREVTVPLFPGYAFVELSSTQHDWSVIRSTRGAVGLVRFGAVTPRVPQAVVQHLREVDGLELQPASARLKPGDLVRVVDGPLAGLEGVFEQRDGERRACVLLEWMQRQVRVRVPDATLVPAGR